MSLTNWFNFNSDVTGQVGGLDFTLQGSGTVYSPARDNFANGVEFNGSGYAQQTTLQLSNTFSAQFWMYNKGTNAFRRWFINQPGSLAGNNTEIFLREGNTGQIQFYALDNWVTINAIAIVRNTWEAWAITAEDLTTSTTVKLYKNNAVIATYAGAPAIATAWKTGIYLGGSASGENSVAIFDDLRIFNNLKTDFSDMYSPRYGFQKQGAI